MKVKLQTRIFGPLPPFSLPLQVQRYIYNKATISSASPTPRVRALPHGFFSRGFPPFYPPPFWPPTVCRRHRPPNPVGLIWIFSIIILIVIKINLAGWGYFFRPGLAKFFCQIIGHSYTKPSSFLIPIPPIDALPLLFYELILLLVLFSFQ